MEEEEETTDHLLYVPDIRAHRPASQEVALKVPLLVCLDQLHQDEKMKMSTVNSPHIFAWKHNPKQFDQTGVGHPNLWSLHCQSVAAKISRQSDPS